MIRDNNSIVIPEKPQALSGIHRSFAAIAATAALLVAPQAVQAQCSPTPTGTEAAPAPASGTVTCQPGDYADGIHYDSIGDLTLEVPDGTDNLTVNDGGVNVTGNGIDNIFWDSSTFTQSISGTGDAVLDYQSDLGNIDIKIGRVSGNSASHGIRAQSSGSGNIDIEVTPLSLLFSEAVTARGAGGTAIDAETAGGDIVIDVTAGDGVEGRHRGIRAQTQGDGDVTISVNELVNGLDTAGTATSDMAAVEAYSGSGDISLTLGGGADADRRSNEFGLQVLSGGIIAETTGNIVINSSGLIQGSVREGGGAAIRTSGNQVTVNLQGDPAAEDIRHYAAIGGTASGRGSGRGNANPAPWLTGGHVDFSAVTGSVEMNIDGQAKWVVTGNSMMSPGHDVLNVSADSVIHGLMGSSSGTRLPPGPHMAVPGVVDFNGGGTVNNQGTVLVGPFARGGAGNPDALTTAQQRGVPAELRFDNLDTFNNSGTVYLGSRSFAVFDHQISGTDGWYDDILALPGAEFVGGGDSRVELDAFLNLTGDPGDTCEASSRNADDDLNGSDCINLRGGSASGRTEIVFNTLIPGDRGSLNPHGLLIVDLAGGSADPDAFVVSPDSDFYSPLFGGIVDKGLFFYALAYDAELQQFRLYGQPGSSAQQLTILGNAANDLWRTVNGGWFDRQTDQRSVQRDAGFGGGVWARVTSSSAERDVTTPIVAGIETFEFDNSYTQDNSALTLGVDLISRSEGNSAWVLGTMIGYARSRIDFDATPSTANLEGGPHVGVYGSLTLGDFYVDAVVNGVWLDMDFDAPALDLFPEGTTVGGDITSIGGRVDAGWGGLKFWRLGIEPLASLSYVKADYREVTVPAGDPGRFGGKFEFQDPESLRAGLGVRLSMTDVLPGFVPVDLGLTTRVMNESEGESTATITSTGPIPVDQTDTFDGTFTEVVGSVNVTNTAKTLSGYLNVDGTFESDYESVGVEAGFRYQW